MKGEEDEPLSNTSSIDAKGCSTSAAVMDNADQEDKKNIKKGSLAVLTPGIKKIKGKKKDRRNRLHKETNVRGRITDVPSQLVNC